MYLFSKENTKSFKYHPKGNCIGGRNYRYFVSFLFFTLLLDLFVLAVSLFSLVLTVQQQQSSSATGGQEVLNVLSSQPVPIILVVYTFLISCSLVMLLGYHVYLMTKNLTTHEQIRDKFIVWRDLRRVENNPFSKGCWENWREGLCGVRKRGNQSEQDVLRIEYWEQQQHDLSHPHHRV